MKEYHVLALLLVIHTAAHGQPPAGIPSASRFAEMSRRNLEANLSPLFDGGGAPAAAAPVQAAEAAATADAALAAAGLVAAGEHEMSARRHSAPPAPLAGLPGTDRMLEGLGGVIPYAGEKAGEAGKIIDAEGERRAREGAQRQREMEERVTGEKSKKYPQYPDRTQEERDKDNGRYPKFDK